MLENPNIARLGMGSLKSVNLTEENIIHRHFDDEPATMTDTQRIQEEKKQNTFTKCLSSCFGGSKGEKEENLL